MNTRKDIMAPRPKKDGGTYWIKIGTAWESERGTQLVFDALPLPDKEGRVVANLYEPRERNDGGQQRQQSGGNRRPDPASDHNLDDDVPF